MRKEEKRSIEPASLTPRQRRRLVNNFRKKSKETSKNKLKPLERVRRAFFRSMAIIGVMATFRLLDNFFFDHALTETQRAELTTLAATFEPQCLNVHPDFDTVFQYYPYGKINDELMLKYIEHSLKEIEPFREHLCAIGVFTRLEQAEPGQTWEKTKIALEAIFDEAREREITIMLNMGVGGAHTDGRSPIAPRYALRNQEWMDTWLQWLQQHSDVVKKIRILYEVNIREGDIAYKSGTPFGVNHEHIHQFKTAFEYLATKVRQQLPEVHIALSLAAFGADYESYVPDTTLFDEVGIDTYEMLNPYNVVDAYNWILGKRFSAHISNSSLQFLGKMKHEHALTTAFHEIGSAYKDMDWLERTILLFLADGGDSVWLFFAEKEREEGVDWSYTDEEKAQIIQIFDEIAKRRDE